MRRTFLTTAQGLLLLVGPLLGCAPQPPLPGTICEAQTEADLQAIAAGELRCASVRIAETELEDLSGLRGLTSLSESVFVFQNERLRDLTGLEDLSHVGAIDIVGNPALDEVELAWHGEVGHVDFYNNPNLRVLSISLDTADSGLAVRDEPVTSLTLSNPAPMQEVRLTHLPELDSLEGLAGLASVEVVVFYDLPSMPSEQVATFLTGLDPAPSYVEICDVEGYPAC